MLASVGVVTQLFGVVLLAAFLLVLRRYADVRGYFGPWTWAWVIYAVAIGAVVTRYFGRGVLPAGANRVLDAIYLVGKLAFFLALLLGALRFAGRTTRTAVPVFVLLAYAAVVLLEGTTLDSFVAWQSPFAVAASAVSAACVLGCPPKRRSIGSRITGGSFAFLTALWTLYGVSFFLVGTTSIRTSPIAALRMLATLNSFIDLIAAVVLAFGMAVLVLEEAKRSADDAHAELARAHEALRQSARLDTLTGALTRAAFREATFVGAGAVALVDLDDLKLVNDAFGHAAGDRMLAHFASTLARALPADARMYRWGGDEFVIVAPATAPTAATRLLAVAIASVEPLVIDDDRVSVGASFGVAGYASAAELDRAVARADEAMYVDKLRRKGTPARSMAAITAAG